MDIKRVSAIGLGLALLASPCGAQTTQTINLAPLQLPSLSVGGVQIPLGFIPMQPITVTFPKPPALIAGAGVTIKTNSPGVWTISANPTGLASVNATNWINITNWTLISVMQTNVQQILITNALPNYIDRIIVRDKVTVTGGITISTNL